ncbi:unnamed protein product, partial [marine sediment metagenome]
MDRYGDPNPDREGGGGRVTDEQPEQSTGSGD